MTQRIALPLLVFFMLALPDVSLAADSSTLFIAKDVNGMVKVDGKPIGNGAKIASGSKVETGPNGHTILVDKNQNGVYVGQSSRLIVRGDMERSDTTIELAVGKVWNFLINALPVKYKVITEHAVAGVRGTIFLVEANKEDTYICSCSGSVEVNSTKPGNFKTVLTTKEEVHRGFKVQAMSGQIMQKPAGMHSHTDDEAKDIIAKLKQ